MSPRSRYLLLFAQVMACAEIAGAAPLGTLEKTFPIAVTKFVLHPTQPYLYASLYSQNSIAIINTQTLTLETTVATGANPTGLAITPDGSRLYVTNLTEKTIGVVDTATRTTLPSIPTSQFVNDVEVGADGRLYVLGQGSIMQINPADGSSAGPDVGPWYIVYSGEMAMSPNKDRLYYADHGLSPASLYQFDVTASPPVMLWESPHGGTSGSNGQDLGISHDGSFISFACGAGQVGYSIAKYDTSNMAIMGTFNTDAYPREITFSPDDAIAYTVNTAGSIKTWNTTTFASAGIITTAGRDEVHELIVDRSGEHLFAGYGGTELRVYATGRFVPEPAGCVLGVLTAVGLLRTRRTASKRALRGGHH